MLKPTSKLFSLENLGGLVNGYLVLKRDLTIVRVCDSFASSLGYSPHDLVGKDANTLFGEPTVYWLKSVIGSSFKNIEAVRNELTFFNRDHRPQLKSIAILQVCIQRRIYYVLLDEGSHGTSSNGHGTGFVDSRFEIQQPGEGQRIPNQGDGRGLTDNLVSLSAIQVDHIRNVLSAVGGNRTRAAQILGISRVTLLNKIKQYRFDDG